MDIFKRTIANLEQRRQKILSGKVNGIPYGFARFEEEYPCIEQKSIIQITANTKVDVLA